MSFALENVPARWVQVRPGRQHGRHRFARQESQDIQEIPARVRAGAHEGVPHPVQARRRGARGLLEGRGRPELGTGLRPDDRALLANWPPEAKGEASPRVKAWMENTVDDGGSIYQFDSADWDWFRQKSECAHGIARRASGSVQHPPPAQERIRGDRRRSLRQAALACSCRTGCRTSPARGVHRGQDGDIVSGWAGIVASQRTWSFGTMVHAMFKENKYFDRDLKINLLYSLWEHINFMRADLLRHSAATGSPTPTRACSTARWTTRSSCSTREWLEGSKSFFETSLTRDFYPCGQGERRLHHVRPDRLQPVDRAIRRDARRRAS